MILIGIIFFLFLLRFHFKRKAKENSYIIKHKKYLRNESKYSEYLEWCAQQGEIPMDKVVFNKEIEERNSKVDKLWGQK